MEILPGEFIAALLLIIIIDLVFAGEKLAI